jgi:hypothetical protein
MVRHQKNLWVAAGDGDLERVRVSDKCFRQTVMYLVRRGDKGTYRTTWSADLTVSTRACLSNPTLHRLIP